MKLIEIKNKLFDKINLSTDETYYLFNLIMSGEVAEIDTASILIALKIKSESKDEILGATKIMREKSTKISSPKNTIDTCGTGGDMSGTLNISTSAALIAASAGAIVAKHGNRSISSKSGSADMLEKLGIKILSEKNELEKSLSDHNFCFLFAQYHHAAMKHVVNIRKQLGTRTIFNLLGPLTNPASTMRQLMGDEISLCSPTYISELKEGQITDYIFDPKDYGYNYININDILGSDAEYNAKTFIEMIEAPNNSFQKIVELNAGAALYLAGLTKNLKDGFNLAKQTINEKKSKTYFANLLNNQ